jgi:hypothetical protein
MRKVVHIYKKETGEHKYYGSLVAAKKGEESLPFHTLVRFKGEVWENKEYIVRFGRLVPSRFRSGEERIVESNVESAIVGNTVVGEVHSCSRCKWLYWNEGEKQFDCGLGYLGKAVKDDLQQENDCNDFEPCR